MLPPLHEVVSEGPAQVTEAAPLECNCGGEAEVAMTDTLLRVECEANVTCSALTSLPGATIVSPILLSLTGVAGQIWALYYLYTSTRPQHSRTVFFLLLSTLIWTDLLGKIITTTPALLAYVYGGWVGGKALCNFHGFSMMLISLVTHLLVSTMAVERFIGIRHGYFYNKNITTTRTKVLLLGEWLFAVLFCALPLFGVGQYALQYPGSWCFLNIHVTAASPLRHRIYTNLFGLLTLLNLLLMVACNIVVITTLLCLRLCRQRCCGTTLRQPQRSYRQRELEIQMVIVLVVITIVFLVSWSPLDMRLFLNQLWPHRTRADHLVDLIAVRLTSINQIIDPWAYIICRKLFVTRAWRWMRLSLMESRFLGRENSSRPGSSKKASKTVRTPDKHLDRPAFKGLEDGRGEEAMGVVVVVEKDTLISPPDAPLLARDSLAAGGRGLEGVGVTKEAPGVFRDSGTGSQHTPSTTDCGPTDCNKSPAEEASEAPIPVFTSQHHRTCPLHKVNHHKTLQRITSSASARAAPASSSSANTCDAADTASGGCESWAGQQDCQGRPHSWCCSQDEAEGKQYRTQSTQTIQPAPPHVLHPHHHDHHLLPHLQYQGGHGHYLLQTAHLPRLSQGIKTSSFSEQRNVSIN